MREVDGTLMCFDGDLANPSCLSIPGKQGANRELASACCGGGEGSMLQGSMEVSTSIWPWKSLGTIRSNQVANFRLADPMSSVDKHTWRYLLLLRAQEPTRPSPDANRAQCAQADSSSS